MATMKAVASTGEAEVLSRENSASYDRAYPSLTAAATSSMSPGRRTRAQSVDLDAKPVAGTLRAHRHPDNY